MSPRAIDASSLFTVTAPDGVAYNDSTGALQQAPADTIIQDHKYDAGSGLWVKRGMPVFPARTNRIADSVGWTGFSGSGGAVFEATAEGGPGGKPSSEVKKWASQTALNAEHGFRFSHINATDTVCMSGFFRSVGEARYAFLRASSGGAYNDSHFDLIDGAIDKQHPAAINVGMEPKGGGWYRCWHSLPLSAALVVYGMSKDALAQVDVIPVGEGILAFGLQFEVGEYPSPYMPTSGAAVTRALIDPYIDLSTRQIAVSDEFTVLVEMESAGGQGGSLAALRASGNAGFHFEAGRMVGYVGFSGLDIAWPAPGPNAGEYGDVFRLGFSVKNRTQVISSNNGVGAGPDEITNATGLSPTYDVSANRFYLGKQNTAAVHGGWVKRAHFIPRALTAAELNARTAA